MCSCRCPVTFFCSLKCRWCEAISLVVPISVQCDSELSSCSSTACQTVVLLSQLNGQIIQYKHTSGAVHNIPNVDISVDIALCVKIKCRYFISVLTIFYAVILQDCLL